MFPEGTFAGRRFGQILPPLGGRRDEDIEPYHERRDGDINAIRSFTLHDFLILE